MNIRVRIEKDEDGWWIATCPSFPGCISQGKTERAALKNISEAISLHIKTLAEDGIPFIKSEKYIEKLVSISL
ncbi:MAG: type II toxin-antitoxin system HicB family antitoxin [Bacteroidetes bacterium]|nr:type II toxin-antitoxin system HicB family antitoxin [Bacteroidota bacterium]